MNDISFWLEATGAQGDPSGYRKTDLEMWSVDVLDRYFHVGQSKRSKRLAFEEIWEASGGDGAAIAYGFDAALRARVYSLAYVKGCMRNYSAPKPATPQKVKESPAGSYVSTKSITAIPSSPKPAPTKPKRTRAPKAPAQPVEDIEWK